MKELGERRLRGAQSAMAVPQPGVRPGRLARDSFRAADIRSSVARMPRFAVRPDEAAGTEDVAYDR
ncbi:MAG: hypothetical protein BGO08_10685 [Altererythrobacter sp. 66-12]|nr:MAG: hypothetical protein BGO08_10685 [Altererythrobacter sp. 66-12]